MVSKLINLVQLAYSQNENFKAFRVGHFSTDIIFDKSRMNDQLLNYYKYDNMRLWNS